MPGFARILTALVLILCCASLPAQDRAALEKQRQKLEEQIRETNTLLRQSQKAKEATVSNLQTLRSEIAMREDLVGSLKKELDFLGKDISANERRLDTLKAIMQRLTTDQAKQLRSQYFEQQMSHPVLFVLSAKNLNDAFVRWQYQKHIAQARKRTIDELQSVSVELEKQIASLERLRGQKQVMTSDLSSQEAALRKSATEAQEMVKSLEKKERTLRTQLEKQQKESRNLAAEIEKIIAVEIKKAAAPAAVPAAPALKALSGEFAKNKGKLPWPVDQGLITSRFGNQPHPVVKSITISNNGIDITVPGGTAVHSIFAGKVVGRKFIPGFDHMVIIQHGNFYTVYSRLTEVYVELQQEVEGRKLIGRLGKSGDENPKLHFEIWENKVQLDPEKWISRS